jgi:hypothetical protein
MLNDFDDAYSFYSRKKDRTEYFYRFIYKWKLIKCAACNGSGHYDARGAPSCAACDDTGKIRSKDIDKR